MRTLALAAAAVMACAQARAATIQTGVSIDSILSDVANDHLKRVLIDPFDQSLGSLQSVTFSISGFADQTTSYMQNQPPSSGTLNNYVQFYNDTPQLISTTAITPSMVQSPTTLHYVFPVNVTRTFSPDKADVEAAYTELDFDVIGAVAPPNCCAYTNTHLTATLTTTYTYAAVPEPITASLLAAPLVCLVARRRARSSR